MAILTPTWMDEPSSPLYQDNSPQFSETLGAAFRQENSLVSWANNGFRGFGRLLRYNPDFNPYESIEKDSKYQPFLSRFLFAENEQDIEFIKLGIDQELRDRDTLSRAGWSGFLAGMVAGTFDPVNLIPIGGSLHGIEKIGGIGERILSGAKRGLAGGAIGAGLQESALYFTQNARSPEEGIVSVGAGAMLGSILGGFVGSIPVKDRIKFQADIAEDIKPIQTDWIAGEEPGQTWRAYREGENYPLTIFVGNTSVKKRIRQPTGKAFYGGFGGEASAVDALDQALNEGIIDQGAYRMMRKFVQDNPSFDAQSSLEIIDAVRYAEDEELRMSGWTQEEIDKVNENPRNRPRIFGETQTQPQGDILHTAIRLYSGHDADTVVEEWYHRFFDRMSDEDQLIYQEYHDQSGHPLPINEHFAQEGRDYFFSTGKHEPAGGIKSLFQKAKDSLRALIDRIRWIRNMKIPEKIQELYREAGSSADENVLVKLEKKWDSEKKSFQIEDVRKRYFDTEKRQTEIVKQMDELENKYSDLDELPPIYYKELKPLEKEFDKLEEERSDLYDSILNEVPNKTIFENDKGEVIQYFSKNILGDDRFHMRFWNQPEGEWTEGLRDDLIKRLEQESGKIPFSQFQLMRKRQGLSYQIRDVYKTLADLPEGVDPNQVRRPDIIPERVWKTLAQVHPGLKVHTLKYLKKPAEIFNNLLEGSERTWKNYVGIGNEESAETKIKRNASKYSVQHSNIFWDNYWDMQKRLTGERQKLQGTQTGKVIHRLFHRQQIEKYKRDVYDALQELHGGKSLSGAELSSRYDPEVVKAAHEIGALYNDLGKRLAEYGLLPQNIKDALGQGYIHLPRVWRPALVRKYRGELLKIFQAEERGDDLPFLATPEELDKAAKSNRAEESIDTILSSPTGYLGIQIDNNDPTDIGTAHFLSKRTIDIDSRKLWTEVEGQRIDFVETDPEMIFRNYIDSVMPDIILSEHFSHGGKVNGIDAITLKPAFEAILEESKTAIKELGESRGKEYDEILAERDLSIKTLQAMRDILRGDYHPNGRPDLSTFAHRVPGLILTINAMQGLGGVVTSSLGDIVTSIAHVGLEPYAKGISDFMRLQGTEVFEKWKKEVTHIWGVAGEMANSARYGAVTDISDVGNGGTVVDRWVNFWGNQMGLITGIDWWNAKLKLMTAFVVQHATVDVANQLAKALEKGKINSLNIETASQIVNRNDLLDFASMGLGLDDLVAIVKEIQIKGEVHDGLTLPRTNQWSDRALASRFESAISKKVDSIIVTPGAGDKPLWTRYGVGKFVSQFKSYPLAAMRKILYRGLQNPDQKLAVGTLASVMMGGLVYSLKTLERGEIPEWDNPAQFLYESIDRAGLFGYLTDVNNYVEKLTYNRIGIAPMLGPLFGLESASRNRWQESILDLAFGPTGDTVEGYHRLLTSTLPHTLALPFGGGPTTADVNQAFKLVWFSRLSGVRSAMEWLRNQAIDNMAVQPKQNRKESLSAVGD